MKNIFKKDYKSSLTAKFGMIIGLYVFVTVIFMSVYYVFSSSNLVVQSEREQIQNVQSISNVIIQAMEDEINHKEYSKLQQVCDYLIENNLIIYTGIVDNKTNKIIWSSDKKTVSKIPTIFSLKYNKNKDVINIKHSFNNDTYAVIGIHNNQNIITIINTLLKGNLLLSMVFILFGFASSTYLARFVTKPLKELEKGAKEFSKGNMSYRSSVNSNDEIGSLSDSFNEMAEKLNEVYISLEQKVEERTQELSDKNNEVEQAYKDLKEAETMMVHNEKMSSLGRLVAGIAHELNNPINFVHGNLSHLKDYSTDLIRIIEAYEELRGAIELSNLEKVDGIKDELDYDFVKDDLPQLINSCQEGTHRATQIVLDLKNFSRLDEATLKEANIEEGIDSTLNILKNKLKDKITIHKDYKNVQPMQCHIGQLNQVFMNILDNSSQAIEETGDIYIKTEQKDDNLFITIEDNGKGISEENLNKIFDPFFTTKPVGKGTGMGLAISYKIIASHKGDIKVESKEGQGSKFTIKIPMNWYNDNIEQEVG